MEYIGMLGTYGWPMVLLAAVNAVLVVLFATKLFSSNAQKAPDINSIMIIAGLVLALGAYSHFSGLQSGLQIFGQINPAMFAGGYAVSLIAMKFGLSVFIVSGFCWFGLRFQLRRVLASA
jgi:hypothetical protein